MIIFEGLELCSLPLAALECHVCYELVENAVYCLQCKQFLCERHVARVHDCPFCRSTPLRVDIDHSIRRLVDQLLVICQYCSQLIHKGDLSAHLNHCSKRPRNCGVNKCSFQTGNKEEALRHVMEVHGDIMWDNYNRLTTAGNAKQKPDDIDYSVN